MDEPAYKELEDWRQQILMRVLDTLDQQPPVSVSWDEQRNRYEYKTSPETRVSLPTEAGVYVFYSARNDKPVYVGQAGNLKERLGHHCRVSGTSVFKRRWIRHWIGAQATEQQVVRHIHSHTYIKYVVLPLGRCEIEADLLGIWKLTGPESVASTDI